MARQYRDAPHTDGDRIPQQLQQLVAKHFELRQQCRSLELKRLESDLQHQREVLDRRAKASSEIIERRVAELLGHADDLSF